MYGGDSHSHALNSGSNLICSGSQSCDATYLENLDNIYSLGYQSMYDTGGADNAVSNVSNIWAYGFESGRDIIISSVYGNIYCYSYGTCQYSSISNVSGNVIGRGQEVLQSCSISDVDGDVYVFGENGLANGEIIHASTV